MTREEAKALLESRRDLIKSDYPEIDDYREALDMAIKALEQKPYEKFESAKDHIYKLAGDYKCWDNRLTKDEAVELCHILEQQPCEDTISRQAAISYVDDVPYIKEHPNVGLLWKAWIESLPSAQPEPHWISVAEDTPDEEHECWITPKTTSKVYRGIFTRHYGECHRTGFICDEGFMWLNTALAWMYCEVPEPYKGVTT